MMSDVPEVEPTPEEDKPSLLRRLSLFVRGDSPSAAEA